MAEGSTVKRKSEEDPSFEPGNAKKKRLRHWTQGLRESMSDPELVIESDDKCVVIKDKYPKAIHHFLVLPKESIPNLKSLKPEHVDLLKHLHRVGEDIIEKTDQDRQFRLGYHAVPSMSHLHLHVISQDFHSPCLKTKRHWNSFTTEYFIDSEDIINRLEIHGRIRINYKESEQILKQDLRCHVCEKPQNNIPSLKAHLVLHDYTKSDLPCYE